MIEYWSCPDCNKFFSDGNCLTEVTNLSIKELGHTEVILPKVEATCKTSGLTEGKKCSACEEVLVKQTEIEALGHNYPEWTVVKEATEETTGLKEKVCSRCNDKQTEIIQKLSHTHNYNKTNYNDEYHWKECECGNISNKTLHTYDEGTKVDNEIIYKCTICGNIKTEPIETNNNTVTVIIIISVSTIALSSLGVLFIIKKKRR